MDFKESAAEMGALPKHHKLRHDGKLFITAARGARCSNGANSGFTAFWHLHLEGVLRRRQRNHRLILALVAFAAGFAVRPFGAIFFGRIGDLVGCKETLLVAIGITGSSIFVLGLLFLPETYQCDIDL